MSLEAQFYWGGAGLIVLWFAAFGLSLVATRNGTVQAAPATQEFGPEPEPPAVVALLANRWRSVDHAAAATLLDLAASGLVEVRQPADDPANSTVHVTGKDAEALTPYERRVLTRITEQAGESGAPIGAIAFRAQERASSWNSALRREIIAEARLRGLSRSRLAPLLATALFVAAFGPGVLFALGGLTGGHNIRGAITVGVLPAIPLMYLLARAIGERATRLGLEREAHWAGVQAWLRAHEDFAQLPPAAVTMWDRYLAYGAALGVTTRTTRLLGFDAGDKHQVWSSYGGAWRPVRIRYPRLRLGFGATTAQLLQLAGAAAVVAVGLALFAALRQPEWAVTSGPDASHSLRRPGLLLTLGWVAIGLLAIAAAGRFSRWTLFVAFLATMPGNYASGHGWLLHAMDRSGPLPGETVAIVCFSAITAYYLTLAALELRAPHTVTGEVLRMEPRKRDKAPRFLAVDTGDAEHTIAWALPAGSPDLAPGSVVRLAVSPATRAVRSAELVTA
ncbi:DUF2207 domain-containing protein [Streptomyces kaniharaensis]|uniref:DUF2207 domain-containing protein n=1 Tax=Streptomyces kaniharaensis TaxID=212423 RepID=A0A6N7KZN4_9ACTN|nr:DUF2207 domain-containing protein [Streptomyces kaniharaensis]MQS15728.1 DUF2207 domain-containing protein [Streptomyces kaniharaensis]